MPLTKTLKSDTLVPAPIKGVLYLAYPLYLRRIEGVVMSNIVLMVKTRAWGALPDITFDDLSEKFANIKRALSKHAIDVGIGVILAVITLIIIIPRTVNADEAYLAGLPDEQTTKMLIKAMQNETLAHGALPEADLGEPKRVVKIPITAYTSSVAQTDSTPCITASGLNVCARGIENVVAANFLPIGTMIRIPDIYGDRVFYVEDRMNARYYYKMDVWMLDYGDARQFGVKYATVEIF